MQKVLKYGIVLALIAFIVLVLMNKDQFSEKVAKIRVFAFLEVEKRVPPIFAKSRKTCTPYFYEKFHKNRYLIFFM